MSASGRPAVLLLSGGLDSTTMLALALQQGFDVHAMTFRYGQRHSSEIEAARRVARHYDVRDHVVVDIDLRSEVLRVMLAIGWFNVHALAPNAIRTPVTFPPDWASMRMP